jgi:hypothetical protein
MGKISDREQAVFDLMKGGSEVQLESIQQAMSAKSRHAAVVRLKYLAAKLAPTGWIIDRTTPIGRGRKACYRMEKKF